MSHGYQRLDGCDVHSKDLEFLKLVDEYWVVTVAYRMHKKSKALKWKRGFPKEAWNQTDRSSYLMRDNDNEFLNSEFKEYQVLQHIPNHS
jgi:hypothetical protein